MKYLDDRGGPLAARTVVEGISRRGFGKFAGGLLAAGFTTPLLNTPLFAQAAPAGTLRISTNADAEILDPNFLLSDVELRLCEMMFNGLVSIDDDLNIIPDLAESWTVSDDARVYEFKLRKGVKFHHGREFDAGDVAFTFERFKESWVGSVVADLKSVDVIDPHTVRLTFGQPAAHFLGSIAPRWCAIVPADVVKEVGNDAFKLKPVGTGAYRFVELVPSQRLVMERFADYFETGRPVIERLEWIPIQDDATRVLQVSAGEIDLDLWAPLRSIPDLEAAAGVKVLGGPTTRYEFAELNNARAPFDNPKIRHAVALATDRQAIVDFVLSGRGEPTNGGAIGPKGNPFFNDLTVYGAPDIEKAKALLAEAGLSGGVTVEGVAPGGSRYAEVLEVLQQQWAAIGVTVNINAIEAGAARSRRNDGDYDLFINGWGTMIDPNDFIGEQFLRTGGLNLGKAGDEKLDELLLAGKREPDMEKRKAIYREAEEYILNTLHPMVFLFRPYNFAAYNERLKGLRHEAGNTRISLQDASLEG
jgi:peptide/nickel transport system substrate-binding protein